MIRAMKATRKRLLENVGIKPATKPDTLVRKAQKRYRAAFARWMTSFS